MGNVILAAAEKYILAHPEIIEQLLEKLVPAVVDAIVAHLHANSKPAGQ
jgi:hypothetical protein